MFKSCNIHSISLHTHTSSFSDHTFITTLHHEICQYTFPKSKIPLFNYSISTPKKFTINSVSSIQPILNLFYCPQNVIYGFQFSSPGSIQDSLRAFDCCFSLVSCNPEQSPNSLCVSWHQVLLHTVELSISLQWDSGQTFSIRTSHKWH